MDTLTAQEFIDALNGMGRACTPLRSGQRAALRGLLTTLHPGIDDNTLRLVGERDLIRMYEAALVDIQRGAQVAGNIARKYTPNPLLDPMTLRPASSDPIGLPPSPPAPIPPSGNPAHDYATRKDIAQLRQDLQIDYRARLGDARGDMERRNDELRPQLTETLTKVTDALPIVVADLTEKALKALTPVTLQVVRPNEAPVLLGMTHRNQPKLIRMLAAGGHVYLHGPAGSGKTTAAKLAAKAFDLPFYFAAKVESEYMLLGFKDARGETVRTPFREAYEHGGLFLFDELDGSSASAVVAMNAALANGICAFPDGVVSMHENFKCIGGGNTKLSGATREYVGRNQLDAASVDRFDFLEWNYDDALETALATNADWCRYVQSARRAVEARALKHLVTPRATFRGCKLLEAGLTWGETETAVLWKGLDPETVRQLKDAMDVKEPKPAAAQSVEIL